jgi:hypothetical protein
MKMAFCNGDPEGKYGPFCNLFRPPSPSRSFRSIGRLRNGSTRTPTDEAYDHSVRALCILGKVHGKDVC